MTSDTIPVLHPAVVRYLPKQASWERTAFVGMTTPARVGSAHPDEFWPLPGGRLGSGVCVRDGRIWQRLPMPRGETPGAFPAERFLSWLRGEVMGPHDAEHLGDLFRGTPLAAAANRSEGAGYHQQRAFRGRDPMPRRIAEMVHDCRDAAPSLLREHLARDVAIVGDAVAVRVDPLVRLKVRDGALHAILDTRPRMIVGRPSYLGRDPLPTAHDRIEAAAAHWFPEAGPARAMRDVGLFRDLLEKRGVAYDAAAVEARHVAQALSGFVGDQLGSILDLEGAPGDEARALDRRLWRARAPSMTGGLPDGEVGPTLDLIDAACALVARHARRNVAGEVEALRRYLASPASPRHGRTLDAEEASSLAALAP